MDKREMPASRWLIIRKLISLVFLRAQVHVGQGPALPLVLNVVWRGQPHTNLRKEESGEL